MFLPIGDNIERRIFPLVPVVLIFLNVLVFAVEMRILFDGPEGLEALQQFVSAWGLVPAELAQWQVIGLITHMFCHGDVLHLLGNMFCLWAFACSLEDGLGHWTLAGFYVLFGVVGGLAQALMDMSSELPIIGASGAIAGLIGAYTVLYGPMSKIHMLVFLFGRLFRVQVPALLFGLGWFGLQLLSASADPEGMDGVAWYAHIGGFIAGAVTTFVCRHETEGVLTEDKHGNLKFADRDEPPPPCPIESALVRQSTQFPVPPTCPHCTQPLAEQHRMAFNLARCGNATCERMVYLEPDPVPAGNGRTRDRRH